jgi:HSP20 family molecular chaperone IbpA
MSQEVTVREKNGTQLGKGYAPRQIAPPVDVFENTDEILVVVDLPGVPSGAVDVRVENDTLTIEAKREAAHGSPALAREYAELDFARAFRIPAGIDAANIQAEAKNGTVVVRLPKSAAAKPRKIPVR